MKRASTVGRPRALSDEQVAAVMRWYDAWLALKDQRAKVKSLRGLAAELGVSPGAVTSAVRRRGQFKQASPEAREETLRANRARLARIRKRRRP